jgi:hypothetical protein
MHSMSEAITKTTPTRRRRGVSKSDSAHADAWLVELCEEFTAIDEERARVGLHGHAVPGSRDDLAYERLCNRTARRVAALFSTIFATPATTPQGLAAKAKIAAKLVSRNNNGEPFYRDRPLNSLAADILSQAASELVGASA